MKKTNGYSNFTRNAKLARKRAEAQARQNKCDGLSLRERLAVIKSRRGESKRELTRLTAK